MNIPKLQFLITDFNRNVESEKLLLSLRDNLQIDRDSYWISYLSNGGNQSYVFDFYQSGLIDQLVIRKENLGGSWAMRDLVSLCQSEYAFLLQNDQYLNMPITNNEIGYLIGLLENYKCVDLAGGQCGANTYSDRAQFVKTADYLEWIKDAKHYGPGPNQHLGQHNEGVIQDVFSKNSFEVYHFPLVMFANNGKWSIREHPCGGVSMHSTDEKKLYWTKLPLEKNSGFDLTDEEWAKSIKGEWVNGTIPENWKKDSFVCFQ
jgi:hypothetical protein